MADPRLLTPRDPEAFRADVLRRAMRIERRRRRARVVLALPAVVAAVLLAIVISDRRSPDPSPVAATGAAVTLQDVALPEGVAPWSVVAGTDDAVWVLSREPAPSLVRVGVDGASSTILLPEDAEPDRLVAGTDGAIWATDPTGSRILRITSTGVQAWPTMASPSASATWLDGRLWFAEPTRDRIVAADRDGTFTGFDVPKGRAPTLLTTGPDGAIWYASSTSPIVGSVSSGGAVGELELGGDDARAVAMAAGPGPSLWLVVSSPHATRLVRLDAQGRIVGEDVVGSPRALSVGPDGRIWLATGDGTLLRQSRSALTVAPLGRPLDVDAWALAEDDSMWAVDRAAHALVRITLPA